MKHLSLYALLLLLYPALLVASGIPAQPSECKLSLYAVDPSNDSLGKRIIGPEQVTSAKLVESTIIEGGVVLKVTLTPGGAAANKEYTSKHIGGKLAILCNGQEVTKISIAGRSAGTFVVEGIEWP